MRAFVLYLNGKKLATAGVGTRGVLSANITWVGRDNPRAGSRRTTRTEELSVVLGGLDTTTDEHLRWRQSKLQIGDEVCLKVVEVESVNRPRHRQRRNRTEELRQQKRYVREMARKFGWTIRTRR